MKRLLAKNSKELNDLMEHFNFCHDGSIRKISFIKQREVDQKGDLIYLADSLDNFAECSISIEMLLNSYLGAKKNQVVVLKFVGVKNFNFKQDNTYDYSDIYEIKLSNAGEAGWNFDFYVTSRKIKALSISCKEIQYKEI